MIKNLKVVNIKTTPFEGRKNWALSNVSNDDIILTEGGNQLSLEYVDYGNGGSFPRLNSTCLISLEQQTADEVTVREGQYTTGIFYSDLDPQNTDGTYKRVIYSQVKTMFYNDYRDPSKMWGLEVLDFEKAGTLKFLTENLRLFSIPQYVFGDKVSEKSVVIYDNSLDNEYLITDDGKENLFAGPNLFSKVQEIGDFENLFSSGRHSGCEYYFDAINTASAPINLTASALTDTTAELTWTDTSTNEDGFVVELSTNSGSTYSTFLYAAANAATASDTTLSSGVTHWYRVYAYNSFGNSNYSNTASATGIIYYAPTIITQPQSITSSVGSNVTFSVTVSGTAPFAYQWKTGSTNIVNGVYITGSTSDTLFLNSITTASEGYNYRVFISNSIGGVTSSYAGLLIPTVSDTLYDMTGSAYILGPYDTFESYDTGSIPTNGGYGWASAWDIRTISAPAIQKVIVQDDFSQYLGLSGSYVSSTNWTGGWGWSGSVTTAYPMTGTLGTLSYSSITRSLATIFTGSVTLNWTLWPLNVNEVKVYRSINNSSSFVQINTILSQSLSVTDVNSLVNGETYYYKLEQWNILSSSFTNVVGLSYNVATESFSTYTLDQVSGFDGGTGWATTWSVKASGST